MTVTYDGTHDGTHDGTRDGTRDGTHEDIVGDAAGQTPPAVPADWWSRAAAFGIDVLLGLGVLACVLMVWWAAPVQGWLWWSCTVLAAVLMLAVAVNRLLLPAATGWSLGRSVVGIAVVHRDGRRPGPWQLLLRDLAHLLDTVPVFLGWLWPLVDRRGRTFADVLVRTEVRRVAEPPERSGRAGRVAAGAALLAMLVAGLGYVTVYRQQVAAAQAREQIAVEGPRIVADMLSYTAATVDEDFARARGLVTGEYRPELTGQQDAVRKAGPVDNDYWVTDSAVLSADGDRATMLLLLQGQRGAEPEQRFLTASVRVGFVKSATWQVSDLTVLTPPKPADKPADKPAAKPAPPATPAPQPKPGGGGR